MPRQKLPAPTTERANLHHENIAADLTALDADGQRRQEILERFGDGQVFEKVRAVNEARFFLAQAANGMLEAGKRLLVIKENIEHGEFLDIVEALGLTPRTAQKMMQAALKFLLPGRDNPKLLALQPTKLIELAVLDDDDVKELAKGKTVAGLNLDEIDTLSTRELRERVREARKQLEAKDKVIAQKNKKLDEVDERNSHKAPYELQFEQGLKDIGAVFDKLQLACAEIARLAEAIPDLEFEGVEKPNDTLTLQAQLAVQFHARSELALEQGVGLFVAARTDFVDALLGMAKKKLPEDIKAKLFEGRQ
jgi:hypothetical protein